MKRFISRQFVGVLALLCSSVGSATTLTVTPSTLTPGIGDTFTVTLNATGAADVGGITVKFAWDPTKVAFTTPLIGNACAGCVPATGPVGAGTGTFDVVTGPNGARILDVLPGAPPVNGDFPLAVLTFQALAAGAMNLVVNDDGGVTTGWFNNTDAGVIPVTYTQATVTVSAGAVPVIAVTTANPLDFGNVTVAATADQAFTVKNNGGVDLVINASGVTLTQAGTEFSITTSPNPCDGATLAPTVSCTFNVRFIPGAVQAYTGSVAIASNDPATPTLTVNLSGNGTAPVPTAQVTDTVAPINDQLIPFGNVTVAGTSPLETVTVTNTGTVGLDIGLIADAAAPGNPLAAPFFISADTCSNSTVAPTGTCTLQVQFNPVAVGPFNDGFSIPSNAAGSPITFTVTGTGVAPLTPDITVTDASGSPTDHAVTFGTVAVLATESQTVTVTNDGSAALNVTSATVAGASFSVGSNGCTAPLAVAASCTIRVDFTPALAQVYPGSLSIASDDPDEATVDVALSGTGTDGILVIDGGSSALDPWSLLLLAGLPLVRRRRR